MQYPRFEFLDKQAQQEEMTCYALGVFESNGKPYTDNLVNEHYYSSVIMPLIRESHFSGKKFSMVSANCFHQIGKIILVGLGKQEDVDQECIRQAASVIYRECVRLHSNSMIVNFSNLLETSAHLKAFAEGIFLSTHYDERFKSQKDTKVTRLKSVHLLGALEDDKTIQVAKEIVMGVNLAKELVNAPANYVTPSFLAKKAIEIAENHQLELHILEKEDCKRLGMGAYLSVTQGSDASPKFIHLCYKPKSLDANATFSKIALIGKGVTFDSGGLNLKIGASKIELMKHDMAGAAVMLGVAGVIGAIKPNKEVHFIIAATENMINGSATKPGDVVTASNGKTIEIDNTDAEGRLTLADALVYAEKLNVDAIVDLATLTGAMVVALGSKISGVFGTDQKLVDGLLSASPKTGEKIWQMPLEESYFEGMSSIVADMKNTGDKEQGAGSISAAMFLKQFVKQTPWAHIDIAGTAWTTRPWFYNQAGGTGFGVRLLVDWILNG
ncbi:leucyl aminopeptidase [Cardinium endosymbiont of Culicoides punctatus]|uniref:leucyl aminopeptidase n=1 Tax=Cardinium endosymbiont of Culicoides punctatus TaxID=2304601 RepID=UPI001F02218A|nr:leucyl aminopeptidase [Cardinium endosymbiont of Culicoides punctatus]